MICSTHFLFKQRSDEFNTKQPTTQVVLSL